jgi:hypothetical protein
VILFQHIVFVVAGAMVDICAEFLGDGFGIAGVSVGGVPRDYQGSREVVLGKL